MQAELFVLVCVLLFALLFFPLEFYEIGDFIRSFFRRLTGKRGRRIVGWTKYENGQKIYAGYESQHIVEEEIRRRGYKFGGEYHQRGEFGVPVLDNGEVCLFTLRSWGEIMARVYGGDYTDMCYAGAVGKVPSKKAVPKYYTADELAENDRKQKEWEVKMANTLNMLDEERNIGAHKCLEEMLSSLFECARKNGMEERICGLSMEEILDSLKGESFKGDSFEFAISAKAFGKEIEKVMERKNGCK